MRLRPAISAVISSGSARPKKRCLCPNRSTRNGATKSTPNISPTHQTNQSAGRSASLAKPPRQSKLTPWVAHSAGPSIAPKKTKRKASGALQKALLPWAYLLMRQVAERAVKILPTARPREVEIEPVIATLRKKAPRKAPGHTRYPRKSKAAKEIPAGSQIAVTEWFGVAGRRPIFPTTK